MRTRTVLPAALISLIALSAATSASGAVTVVGGGLAQACSQGVKAGRMERFTLEICTRSLSEEALRRKDRGATLVNRGIIYLRTGDYDLATRDFNRAELLTPTIGETFVNRGAVLIHLDRYEEAVADIDRGIALGLEEPEKAYYNRALAREKLDDYKGAYMDFRKAVELDPEWTLPATQLARFTVTRR